MTFTCGMSCKNKALKKLKIFNNWRQYKNPNNSDDWSKYNHFKESSKKCEEKNELLREWRWWSVQAPNQINRSPKIIELE